MDEERGRGATKRAHGTRRHTPDQVGRGVLRRPLPDGAAEDRAGVGSRRLGVATIPLVLAEILSACAISEGDADGAMWILNATGGPIVVTYQTVTSGQVDTQDVTKLGIEETTLVSSIFGGERCLRGEFVVTQAQQVIERRPQPCMGQRWEVTGH